MQPRKPKNYLNQIFYIDFENELIHSKILSIRVYDLDINKMVLVYLK